MISFWALILGLDRAVYISPDFPINDNVYGIHPVLDDIIDLKNK